MRGVIQPARVHTASRWVGVGSARGADPVALGATAARAALTGAAPQLLLVFAGGTHELAGVAAGVGQVAPGVATIGCSSAAELTGSDGPQHDSVVVAAIGGAGFSVSTTALDPGGGLRAAGAEAGAAVGDIGHRPHQALLLLADARAGDPQELVRGVYGVVGAGVPLVGAATGWPGDDSPTAQLHAGTIHEGAVIAAAIGSDAPLGIGVSNGWKVHGEPFLVTHSEGARVFRLDGRKALDAYLDRIRAPQAVRDDRDAILALAASRPLALARRAGEPHVRVISDVDVRARSLEFLVDIAHGGLIWATEGARTTALAATEFACTEAIAALDGAPVAGLLAFDSLARRDVLGPENREAVSRIVRRARRAPVAGFASRAQLARTRGLAGLHQHSLAVLALA